MNAAKWICRVCTYENWPASSKCVICCNPKQSAKIEEEIYKLALTSSSNNCDKDPLLSIDKLKLSSEDSFANSDIRQKWSCSACTYLNWPKARKCIQCRTPKSRRGSPTLGAQSQDSRSSADGLMSSSPPASSVIKERPFAPPTSAVVGINKWCCPICTYENWPKNTTCVMCKTSRIFERQTPNTGPTVLDNNSADASNKTLSTSLSSSSPASNLISSASLHPVKESSCGIKLNNSAQWSDDTWRRIKTAVSPNDWLWLNACRGAVEGDLNAIDNYLANGGNVNRKMTPHECRLLNRSHIYEVGMTLARLAVKFNREDVIDMFVLSLEKSVLGCPKKRMPCHLSPDVAQDIRKNFTTNLRQRKGDFPCYFVVEHNTFVLPEEIDMLTEEVQDHLFTELLDTDVQKELEIDAKAINWWIPNLGVNNRLLALWNRTAGDCLLDSVLQATWGILDRDNTLRLAMADSLRDGQSMFFTRWREYEAAQALTYQYSLDEYQWQRDWENLMLIASQPGESLEQIHIFTLCHILRRPIIVYGVKYINNMRSEPIGIANFQGVYLPLLWERPFCSKNPLVLGYTRGHFSALVPLECSAIDPKGAGALMSDEVELHTNYLPLMDKEGKLLPIHFTTADESRHEETLLRDWLDCCHTRRGLLLARMRHSRRHPLVRQMLDDWLDNYRQIQSNESPQQNEEEPPRDLAPPVFTFTNTDVKSDSNLTLSDRQLPSYRPDDT